MPVYSDMNGHSGASTTHQGNQSNENLKVLVADDEKVIRELVSFSLRRLGYDVVAAQDGREALEHLAQERFDLVVLDVLMPKIDGFAVCAELRKYSDVPVVMLTSLTRPDDIVRGLELGADNYITKPFTFKEVEARIKALMRRTALMATEQFSARVLEQGDVVLNVETREVTVVDMVVELTQTEYSLLHYLMSYPDRPVSKEELLQKVWGYQPSGENSNLVELAVRRLRKKIEDNPSSPKRLVTIRGIGYKFSTHSKKQPQYQEAHHRVFSWKPQPEVAALMQSDIAVA